MKALLTFETLIRQRFFAFSEPDRTFHSFWASKLGDWRTSCSSETSLGGFWGYEIVKCSVGNLILFFEDFCSMHVFSSLKGLNVNDKQCTCKYWASQFHATPSKDIKDTIIFSIKRRTYISVLIERLESVRIGKCQNPFLCQIGKCQNRKVSESESVRIGKCQNCWELESVRIAENWKVSEFIKFGKCQNSSSLESVRIGKCQKLLGLESVRIGKCQKLLRLESVRNSSDWKVSEIAWIGKCQKLLRLESVRIGKCQKLLRLEWVRSSLDWKVSEIAQIGKCQKLLWLESVRIRNGKVLGVPMGSQCSKSL